MAKKRGYYVRPDGLHETSRLVNGKRVVFRGRTDREVDQKILAYHEEVEKGRYLDIIADEWLEATEAGVAPGTHHSHSIHVKRFKEDFAGKRASEVDAQDVYIVIRGFEKEGYCHGYCAGYLSVIRGIFEHAILSLDTRFNPAKDVSLSRGLPKGERRALTEEEEQKVYAYRGEDWLLGVFLALTGLRRGELIALQWSDIDRKRGVISVTKKHGKYTNQIENHLKSKRGTREVPIFDMLAEVLPKNRIGYVFPGKNGSFMNEHEYIRRFAKYREAVGLPDDITSHSFRHTMATLCFEAGMPIKDTARILGDTEQIVERVYIQLRDAHHESQVERLNAYMKMRAEQWTAGRPASGS